MTVPRTIGERTPALVAAYAFCRAVARREAKNFYWAFRVLPKHKSDAMCAVYAFMRKADDLADDESMSLEARRTAMQAWTETWRRSRAGGSTEPLFLALNDTQQRFAIPDELLEQLVAGTTMDLQPQMDGVVVVRRASGAESSLEAEEYQAFESFEALYRYCFLVASVVGLVTIRIFGYRDASAEKLAEHTGIAFQLTNILRDVREDAERKRVYLPLREMEKGDVSLDELIATTKTAAPSIEMKAFLQREINRAQAFYADGEALIPLIDRDAQPAMRVLITIYHRLLERIAQDPTAVFRERVSVPTPEKLAILGRGLLASVFTRSV
ncbi:MAG: phytoene/squalene synthase family protein [Janthinobacterium lividum]